MKVEIRSFKADNERLVKAQETQVEVNVGILQSFSKLQRQKKHESRGSYRAKLTHLGSKERTNGANDSSPRKRHKRESEDAMKGNAPLSIPEGRINTHGHNFGRHSGSVATSNHSH